MEYTGYIFIFSNIYFLMEPRNYPTRLELYSSYQQWLIIIKKVLEKSMHVKMVKIGRVIFCTSWEVTLSSRNQSSIARVKICSLRSHKTRCFWSSWLITHSHNSFVICICILFILRKLIKKSQLAAILTNLDR